jgi:hypothetical protein
MWVQVKSLATSVVEQEVNEVEVGSNATLGNNDDGNEADGIKLIIQERGAENRERVEGRP